MEGIASPAEEGLAAEDPKTDSSQQLASAPAADAAEDTSEDLPEHAPEHASEDSSEHAPEHTSEDASEDASEAASSATRLAPVQVTATRSALPVPDPTTALVVVGEDEIRTSASRTIDDVLRRIPGLSLFRRLGSGTAHPTAQGLSLRGIGPSGTSRALVLVDGVPLNDPFGGWIHWNRIPTETIRRVEVARGSGASLWGNYAMGGVVGVVTREPDEDGAGLVVEGGEREGGRVEGWASREVGRGGLLADARWMRSPRFPVVRADSRGPIDVSAGSEHGSGGLRLDQRVSEKLRLRASARGYHDARDNGTPYQHNRTTIGSFTAGADVDTAARGSVRVDAFAAVQDFESTFSAVAADRASETPAADQFDVPATSAGGSVVWTHLLSGRHRATAGLDTLYVDGRSRELARYLDGTFTRLRDGGATHTTVGLFAQDVVEVGDRVDLVAALRLDHWRASDMFRTEADTASGGLLIDRDLGSRDQTFVSPRLALAWAALDSLVARAAVYRGFRAPTINEQIRPFRVRNDITEANEGLRAEQLFGVEAGADAEHGRWRASGTLFWNRIDDPVFNVTVGEGPGAVEPCGFVPAGGVCRQRQNLGASEVLGVEAAVGVDLGRAVSLSLAYLWSDSEIASARQAPGLVGNRAPQVPRHQGTVSLGYDDGGPWRAAIDVRIVGMQYEDDTNTRALDRFAAVDAFVARRIGAGFELFAAAENLLDAPIQTGRGADGVVATGVPRLLRAGLRWGYGD